MTIYLSVSLGGENKPEKILINDFQKKGIVILAFLNGEKTIRFA